MILWPPLIQQELDEFCELANNRRIRKQKDKILPSGVSPNYAYTFPEKFGGEECLQPVNRDIVQEILDNMKAEHEHLTSWGVPDNFKAKVKLIKSQLGIEHVTLCDVWIYFNVILNLL